MERRLKFNAATIGRSPLEKGRIQKVSSKADVCKNNSWNLLNACWDAVFQCGGRNIQAYVGEVVNPSQCRWGVWNMRHLAIRNNSIANCRRARYKKKHRSRGIRDTEGWLQVRVLPYVHWIDMRWIIILFYMINHCLQWTINCLFKI